jgi:hypothetical protein
MDLLRAEGPGLQTRLSTILRIAIFHPHKNVYKADNKKVGTKILRFQFRVGIYPQVLCKNMVEAGNYVGKQALPYREN